MKKTFFFLFSILIPLLLFSFGRSISSNHLSLQTHPDWGPTFTLTEKDLSLLQMPKQLLTLQDLYLLDDPSLEQLFQTMTSEVVAESDEHAIAGLDYTTLHAKIEKLSNEGHIQLQGEDAICRPIAVTLQGVFEEALADALDKGMAHDVKAIFLTNAPATPLMKHGETSGLTTIPFDPARKYTLDKREFTLRKLIAAGAKVLTAFSAKEYDKLKSDASKVEQVTIFEEGLQDHLFTAYPLYGIDKIPEENIGAFYQWTTPAGQTIFFALRGIQAREAKPGIWEMWLASDQNPLTFANQRRVQVLSYILSPK